MTEKTTAVQIVMTQHCNGYSKPRLFGGQIMAWIDVTGAVAARRYTQKAVTTVCIDHLTFLKPAYLKKLSVGEHRLTIEFDDGSLTTAFTIRNVEQNDDSQASYRLPITGVDEKGQ